MSGNAGAGLDEIHIIVIDKRLNVNRKSYYADMEGGTARSCIQNRGGSADLGNGPSSDNFEANAHALPSAER